MSSGSSGADEGGGRCSKESGDSTPVPTPSQSSSENTSESSSTDWLREALRMFHSTVRSARAAKMALRSSSATLRPAENLICTSAISLGSAANCVLAASTFLCTLAQWPDSPVPELFHALREASKRMCEGAYKLNSQKTRLSRDMRSTSISLALAAASFEEVALKTDFTGSRRHKRGRNRSRSSRDGISNGESSVSESPHAGNSSDGKQRITRSGTNRNEAKRHAHRHHGNKRDRNIKISQILIKHNKSRRPIDNKDKPVSRTRDEAIAMAIDIHQSITKDLITFADAAVSFSECTSARHQGDIADQFKQGDIQKSFEDAAFSLAPGQVSNIIESNSGYHILQRRE